MRTKLEIYVFIIENKTKRKDKANYPTWETMPKIKKMQSILKFIDKNQERCCDLIHPCEVSRMSIPTMVHCITFMYYIFVVCLVVGYFQLMVM